MLTKAAEVASHSTTGPVIAKTVATESRKTQQRGPFTEPFLCASGRCVDASSCAVAASLSALSENSTLAGLGLSPRPAVTAHGRAMLGLAPHSHLTVHCVVAGSVPAESRECSGVFSNCVPAIGKSQRNLRLCCQGLPRRGLAHVQGADSLP